MYRVSFATDQETRLTDHRQKQNKYYYLKQRGIILMANKTDGITDLTKVLVSAAKKFSKKEYNRLSSVIFAMLHGVSYGYDEMDQRFINDAADVYEFHQDHDEFLEEIDKELDEVEETLSKFKKPLPPKSKDNVIKFSDYKQDVTNDGG